MELVQVFECENKHEKPNENEVCLHGQIKKALYGVLTEVTAKGKRQRSSVAMVKHWNTCLCR